MSFFKTYTLDKKIYKLLSNYNRDFDKFSSSPGIRGENEAVVQNSFEVLVAALKEHPLIGGKSYKYDCDALNRLRDDPNFESFIKEEVFVVASVSGKSTEASRQIVVKSLDNPELQLEDDLLIILSAIHYHGMKAIRIARAEERDAKRKLKKSRRAATELGVFGVAITLANGTLLSSGPWSVSSMTAGGGMVVKSLYDIRKGP